LMLQGAVAGGTTAWAALDPQVIQDVLGTRFGLMWGVAALVWMLVAGMVAARPRALPVLRPASLGATGLALPTGGATLAGPLAALALLPALGGHASVQQPVALLLPANVLHVVAIGAWLGGIAVMVTALRAATTRLEPSDRTRLLAATVGRFSAMAGLAIAVVLASGVVQGLIEVRTLPNLVETAFGRTVLVKVAIFAGIVALGWVNRRRLLPQLRQATTPGRAGLLLRRTLRAELALGVAALAATGALAGYAPSVAESQGPFSTTASIGPARLEATVDPARVGPNEMHLYLFDRRDGRQYDATKELTVTAALPEKGIEPIELAATKAGPGHYVVSGAALAPEGEWTVEVAARVTEFDEHRTTFQVPIQ
ncbi:MAG: copper resistance D family protein, partial [Solirubrobacteraceae bacterium]